MHAARFGLLIFVASVACLVLLIGVRHPQLAAGTHIKLESVVADSSSKINAWFREADVFIPFESQSSYSPVPLTPDTSLSHESTTATSTEEIASVPILPADTKPARLRIPSIRLDAPIQPVSITESGAMDVPDGKSKNVGWYEHGTLPGKVGSAVMDAHVYAAFKNLRKAKVGADVYVDMSDGSTLHFQIMDSRLYKLADVPGELIFARADGEWLNFITCAGTFIKSWDTYDHRLVVYTKLVK